MKTAFKILLHLFLTIATYGVWLIVLLIWFLVKGIEK